jgi:hypothetical protein
MTRVHFTAMALTTSVLSFGIGFSVSAGELRPTEKIPDIDKAPKNTNGLVEYSAKISLIFPKNPKSGNDVLLVDIPNRGRPYALRAPSDLRLE